MSKYSSDVTSFSLTTFQSLSLVHFKNGTEYLTKENPQVLIPLMRYLPQSLVPGSILVLLVDSFLIFLSWPLVWLFLLLLSPSTCTCVSLQTYQMHSWYDSSVLSTGIFPNSSLFLLSYSLRVFHITVSWWPFSETWVTTWLLKSPGVVSVFWPIYNLLKFGWSPHVPLFPSLPVLVSIFWWLCQEPQLQWVSPSLSCSTVFSIPSNLEVFILLFTYFKFYSVVSLYSKVHNSAISLYYYYSLRVFHISISRWFFSGVWVTTSLLKSSGFFSVFWVFSIMLTFGWSSLVRQLPSHPGPTVIL